MKIIKAMTVMLFVTSIAMAHDHTGLFDKCAVTGCVACEPSANIDEGTNSKNIGVWLQPTYRNYSLAESSIPGFFPGHEGERPHKQGLGVDHTEFYWSAAKADQLRGSAVIAIAEHEGETEIEFEEAYIETLNSYLLPEGMNIKLGRAFWTLGSLNAQHSHSDSFADRPLPYRVFLDKAFNDDGAEISYVLQNSGMYTEVGLGTFRGNDLPFGGVEEGQEENTANSAYVRVGGKLGAASNWRLGAYMLAGEVGSRVFSNSHDDHGHEEEEEEEEHHDPSTFTFSGDSDLYIYDARFAWAPTGDSSEQELVLSAEYFSRVEDGSLTMAFADETSHTNAFGGEVTITEEIPSEVANLNDVDSSGWYVQAVYKFNPKMRAGIRYSKLGSPDLSVLDEDGETNEQNPNGYDPVALAYMIDWNHSENSLIRLQLNQEEMADGEKDDQFIVQYIMNLQIRNLKTSSKVLGAAFVRSLFYYDAQNTN